jgi:hypothetical protein
LDGFAALVHALGFDGRGRLPCPWRALQRTALAEST